MKKWPYIEVNINGRRINKHVLIAEEVLGKPLPQHACVHHTNGNASDNRKENLVICENQIYHMLLHQRAKALKACGYASWRKCSFCKQYDHPDNLYIHKKQNYHRSCAAKYARDRWRKKNK